MQPEQLQQIKGYYLEATEVHLQVIEQYLMHLQNTLKDPEQFNDLCHVVRCSVVGGANLLPISQVHIKGIHQIGLWLLNDVSYVQNQFPLKVDPRLKNLFMEVFYIWKELIQAMNQPSNLTDEEVRQIIVTTQSMREQLKNHLKGLIERSRQTTLTDVEAASVEKMETPSVEELQSLIDELLQER